MSKKRNICRLVLVLFILSVILPGTKISAEETNDVFKIEDGVLVSYNGTDRNVTVPSTVTSIGEDAFSSNEFIESVSIPSSVQTIGDRAFYICSNLKSVSLNIGLTRIGEFAFKDCNHLESVI